MKNKKLFSAIVCLILVLVMMVSCTQDTITPDAPAADGTTDTDRTVEQLPPGLYADINNTAIKIICPDAEEAYYNKHIPSLIKTIANKTGVTLSAATDFEKGNTSTEIKNDNYEILLGGTNRLETALTECPENSFVIKVVGKKVVIKGSSQYYTTMGLFYFIDNCIGSSSAGTLLNINTDYSYTESPENAAFAYIDRLEKKNKTFQLFSSSSDADAFKATGKTFAGKTIALTTKQVYKFGQYFDSKDARTIANIQGGCTDGKYFYFLLTNPKDGAADAAYGVADETRVIKMDPKTMEIVQIGPIISVAHSNDLTYDSKYNRLVVAWCSVDATTVSYIDMNTLKVTSSPSFSQAFFAIDYDEVGNRMVFSGSKYAINGYPIIIAKNAKTATAYQKVKEFKGISMGYVSQGIHCDSKYIYYTASPNNAKTSETYGVIDVMNIVNVYDYDGNYICTLTIDLPDEIEHIFWYDNSFWAGFNCSNGERLLYQLSF
ncbi:MAG: hypothetical protein E7653_06350 [Ruminococcaceae bacterium]|nr:hypothetical protein [Oscillospiraceae bacterium]